MTTEEKLQQIMLILLPVTEGEGGHEEALEAIRKLVNGEMLTR